MRGAFPGDAPPAHDPIGHLAVVPNADAFLVAPASANTIAKLAAGICRLDAHDLVPRLHGSARRGARDERPHVRRRGDAGEPGDAARARRATVIEPETGALASRGEHGTGRLPSPERLLAEVEAMLPAARGPGTACGCW